MPSYIFQKVVADYAEYGGQTFGFAPMYGDPLSENCLIPRIRFIRDVGIPNCGMYTACGEKLTASLFAEMVDAGLRKLSLSMSAFDERDYQRVFGAPAGALAKTLENLGEIAALPAFGKCPVTIEVRSAKLRALCGDAHKMLKNMGYHIGRNYTYDNWGGLFASSDLPGWMFVRPVIRNKRIPCVILRNGLHVLPNGDITPCACRDYDGTLSVGNVRRINYAQAQGRAESMFDEWRSGGRIPNICKSCGHYNPDATL